MPALKPNQAKDRQGRVWTMSAVPLTDAEEQDARFWLAVPPEQRVELLTDLLLAFQKVKGKRDLPRFRRVYRVVAREAR